jgi:hypothetical protein
MIGVETRHRALVTHASGEWRTKISTPPTLAVSAFAQIVLAFRGGIPGTDSSRGVPSEGSGSEFDLIHRL